MAQLAELKGPQVPLKGTTWDIVTKGFVDTPYATAITVLNNPSDYLSNIIVTQDAEAPSAGRDDELAWTYRQLFVACQRVSRLLLDKGVKRGSTLFIYVDNSVEWAIAFWVAANLQLTFVPFDPQSLVQSREDQVLGYFKRLQPGVVITDTPERAQFLENILSQAGAGGTAVTKLVFGTEKLAALNWLSDADVAGVDLGPEANISTDMLPQDQAVEKNGQRIAFYYFTSGTSSGRPKGCPGIVQGVLSGMHARYSTFEGGPEKLSYMLSARNYGVVNWALAMHAWSRGDNCVCVYTVPKPAALVAALDRFTHSALLFFPSLLPRFAASAPGRVFPNVASLSLGGDIVTGDMIDKARQIFPNADVRCTHGMSEGGGVFHHGPSTPNPIPLFGNIASVGKVGPNTRLRMVGEDGKPVRRGEVGDIHLSAPQIVSRYLDNVSPESFYSDARGTWLKTGDRGVVDEAGYVYLLGRTKDDIKMDSISLSPSIPESVLNQHENIDALIIGVPSTLHGQKPVAVVVDHPSIDKARIKRLVLDKCGADYALADVYLLSELGFASWPISDNNKVLKREILDALVKVVGGSLP